MRVTVLEASDAPGGAVRSREDTLPGFVHDTCSGFYPLALASPAMRSLALEQLGVEWVDPPVPMAHPFPDGSAIALHRDVDATAASLDAQAPGAGAAWRDQVVEPLRPHRELLFRTVLAPFPPTTAAAALALRLRHRALKLVQRGLGSAAAAGLDLFGNERAAAWLAGSAAHSDLSPGAMPGGALALGLGVLGHFVGWPFPRGGAGRLTDALVKRLTELGGEVRSHERVEAIVVRNRRAVGVRTSSGEEIPADAVVATLSAGALARLVPAGALPGLLERRLRDWRYGLGTFKLDLALRDPVPWKAEEARTAAVVHVAGELDALFRSVHDAAAGRVPREPALVVGQHTLHDPTRAPRGRHTLYVYTHVPRHPPLPDAEIPDLLEERIESFAPGFRSLILGRAVRGPEALERENPSLVGGDLGGGSYELGQQLAFRPAIRLLRGRTPLRGLYVGGASIHPGGGVHGVSGAAAATAVLADASPDQPR